MSPPLALLFGLRLSGVVDRIEGDFAVVEWAEGDLSDVPLSLLPERIEEGDTLVLRLRPRPDGALALGTLPPRIATPKGPLTLPSSFPIRSGSAWHFRTRAARTRPRPADRAVPNPPQRSSS